MTAPWLLNTALGAVFRTGVLVQKSIFSCSCSSAACTRADCPSEGCRRQCYLHSSQMLSQDEQFLLWNCRGAQDRPPQWNPSGGSRSATSQNKDSAESFSHLYAFNSVPQKEEDLPLPPRSNTTTPTPPPALQRPPLPGGRQRDDAGSPLASHPTQTHTTTSPLPFKNRKVTAAA